MEVVEMKQFCTRTRQKPFALCDVGAVFMQRWRAFGCDK